MFHVVSKVFAFLMKIHFFFVFVFKFIFGFCVFVVGILNFVLTDNFHFSCVFNRISSSISVIVFE